MNGYREDNSCCHFHPKEFVVGVCPLCLNERLLILAAKQGNLTSSAARGSHRRAAYQDHSKKTAINLPKIFALGTFLNRLEFRHSKSDHFPDDNDLDASTSQEDSFISIKFEDNGAASWEKGAAYSNDKVSLKLCSSESFWKRHDYYKNRELEAHCKQLAATNKDMITTKETTMTVVEHGKPRASLRWQKRIGHLFQLMRWKRSNKGNVSHVGTKVEGVKVTRKGWIRTRTKKTKEQH